MWLGRQGTFMDYCISLFMNSIFRIQSSDSNYFYSFTHQYAIYKLCLFFSKHYNIRTNLFVDIVAADFPQHKYRFFLSYNLFSISYNLRVFFSFFVQNASQIYTITKLFCSANWYEREIWDLFGIAFRGHADLRRILTDYGFNGHPLKKDYPLSGFIEVRYDEHYKCIRYNPVHLVQEFRCWSFEEPWDSGI